MKKKNAVNKKDSIFHPYSNSANKTNVDNRFLCVGWAEQYKIEKSVCSCKVRVNVEKMNKYPLSPSATRSQKEDGMPEPD